MLALRTRTGITCASASPPPKEVAGWPAPAAQVILVRALRFETTHTTPATSVGPLLLEEVSALDTRDEIDTACPSASPGSWAKRRSDARTR